MISELEAKGNKRTRNRKEKERKQEICNEGKKTKSGGGGENVGIENPNKNDT